MTTIKQDGGGRGARAAFHLYKAVLSPLLHALSPGKCIYLPTCSEYAFTAIHRFGAMRGSWMALRRLMRCHPWAAGGFDPVPDNGLQGHAGAPSSRGEDHLP